GFRRGVLVLCIGALWGMPRASYAWEWRDLWLRRDQQGQQLLEDNQPDRAAAKFDDPRWRSVAQYRAGKFNEAVEGFMQQTDADAHYNRGNALASAGRYDDAIAAYEQALRLQQDHADAQYNLELIKKARQQQKNTQDGQNKSSQGQNGQNQPQQGSSTTPQPGEQGKQPGHDAGTPRGAQNKAPQDRTGEEKSAQTPQGMQGQEEESETDARKSQRHRGDAAPLTAEQREQERYVVQQLRRVPDDPGGLLRQKFLREQQRRQGKILRGERP
ncbi:MAG: tetratricopeptide repeat protein, partial [Gammaproteobacteria bacterium]|nr:tetratricopeptide repeat protein [Gammaproteobacteria bacterium]